MNFPSEKPVVHSTKVSKIGEESEKGVYDYGYSVSKFQLTLDDVLII